MATHICVDSLGDDYPTFTQFQQALRVYEADLLKQYREAEAEERRTHAEYLASQQALYDVIAGSAKRVAGSRPAAYWVGRR